MDLASGIRQERYLMRQRGAGARPINGNFGFVFKAGPIQLPTPIASQEPPKPVPLPTSTTQSADAPVLDVLSVVAGLEPSKSKRKAPKKRKALFTKKKPSTARANGPVVPDAIDDHVQSEKEISEPAHVDQEKRIEDKKEDELSFDKSPVAKKARRVKRKLLIELDEQVEFEKKIVEDDFVFRRRKLAASTPDIGLNLEIHQAPAPVTSDNDQPPPKNTSKKSRKGNDTAQVSIQNPDLQAPEEIMTEESLPIERPPKKIRKAIKPIMDAFDMQPDVDGDAASVPARKMVRKGRKVTTTAADIDIKPAPRKRGKKAVLEAPPLGESESHSKMEDEEHSVPTKKLTAKPRCGKKTTEHVEQNIIVEGITDPAKETAVKPRWARTKISDDVATEIPVVEEPGRPPPKAGRRKAAAPNTTEPSLDENATPAPTTTKRKRQPLSEQEANTSSPQKLPIAGNHVVQEEPTKNKRAKTVKTTTKPRMTKRAANALKDESDSNTLALETVEQVHTSATEHASLSSSKTLAQPRKGRAKKPLDVFSSDKPIMIDDVEPVSPALGKSPDPVPSKRAAASKTTAKKPVSQKSQNADIDADLFAPMTTTSLPGGVRKQAKKSTAKPRRVFAAREEDVDLSDVFDGIAVLAAGGSA